MDEVAKAVQISIRAPARGATNEKNDAKQDTEFQSALPRGERRGDKSLRLCSCDISIRAPARGATRRKRGV